MIAASGELGKGKAPLYFSMVEDVTERKLTEEALRRAHERFQNAASAVHAALYD